MGNLQKILKQRFRRRHSPFLPLRARTKGVDPPPWPENRESKPLWERLTDAARGHSVRDRLEDFYISRLFLFLYVSLVFSLEIFLNLTDNFTQNLCLFFMSINLCRALFVVQYSSWIDHTSLSPLSTSTKI